MELSPDREVNGGCMKHYIVAHRKDGSELPGTDYGQTVLYCKDYRRTLAYKAIKNTKVSPPVAYYTIQVPVDGHYYIKEVIHGGC